MAQQSTADETTAGRHAFYRYMFEKNKQPTLQLDSLLRGVANYIVEEVGDKQIKTLTPEKLAAFYKAVGGDYDALFVDIPNNSLSYIYASIGCEHTLQPNGNDYALPTIPALTVRGFSRWQSIEILLGPEEHVPFMQRAVKNFGIRNPDNNELFPPILPVEVFPREPDADIERWHTKCAEKLRQEATPTEEQPLPPRRPRPKVHVQTGFAYVPAPRQTRAPYNSREYFEAAAHFVPLRQTRSTRPMFHRNSSYHGPRFPESPESPRTSRRRSFPENSSSPNLTRPPADESDGLKPPGDDRNRRHSHPRHKRNSSSSSVSGDEKEKPVPKEPPIITRDGTTRKSPRFKPQYPPQDQPPWIRINIPPNLRSEPNSPHRSNSRSSSNSYAGVGARHSRNNSDNDSIRDRERRRAHMNHPPVSMDSPSGLSAQFMQGRPSSSRSNSRVRRSNIPRGEDFHPGSRRMSMASASDEEEIFVSSGSGTGAAGLYHRKRPERSGRSQDRGKTDRKRREKMREKEKEKEKEKERERERGIEREIYREKERQRGERERGREKERDSAGGVVGLGETLLNRSASIGAKLGLRFGRTGNHDVEREREERRDRQRERERDDRERGRDRDRRELRDRDRRGLGSPTWVGDARRYPEDGVVRR